jgi:hypothetical protein
MNHLPPETVVLAIFDRLGVKLPLWRLIINREICWCRYERD